MIRGWGQGQTAPAPNGPAGAGAVVNRTAPFSLL